MSVRRVLVLYTGGTIGMTQGPRGWVPAPGLLVRELRRSRAFHVEGEPDLTLPTDIDGLVVRYTVREYPSLLDSANMGPADWVGIANDIAAHDAETDAFVVLHGTDTMAYTASALSFMLEGLSKPVIFTGSQIPFMRVRNDATANLLGALTLASRADIPEVGLYFRDSLLRGNRATKVDASGLDAFASGNLRPLARVGVDVTVDRDLVRPPGAGPVRVVPITQPLVACFRWFPGLTPHTLDAMLQAPLQGVVLQTFGAGNAPDNQPELLRVLRKATDSGLVLTHVTQCLRGTVRDDYAGGRALAEAGVVGGLDMTAEAALTKLMWLLSQPHLTRADVRRLFATDLRGELGAPQ